MPITFSDQDVNLALFPHTNTMVLTVYIDRWDATKILIDNYCQVEILFRSSFRKWAITRSSSKKQQSPLYSIGGKRTETIKNITLPISFGTPRNPHTEHITLDVVDMLYTYNAIFRRGLLNTFEAALHSGHLCLKVPTTFGIITVFDSQKQAGSIEHGFILDHKNVHFLREDARQHEQVQPPSMQEALAEFRKAIEAEGNFKQVPLDPMTLDRVVSIGTNMSLREQTELLQFLNKNNDFFA
jgi:hypothetical protein